MRIRKPALAVLAVFLLSLAAMTGFFLGRNTVAGPVRVVARSAAQSAQESEPPESQGRPLESGAPESRSQPPESGAPDHPVNINTATVEELQALPGIGETRAQAIVAYREAHGPFAYVEDLLGVSGIGKGILENIIDYVTVGEQDNG